MDVPKDIGAVLKFIELVEDYNQKDVQPTVVHCRFANMSYAPFTHTIL